MKNRATAFGSFLFMSCILFMSCTSDTDTNNIKDTTTEIATLNQYEQVQSANREIQTVFERFFNSESGLFGIASLQNKSIDCPTVRTENDGTNITVTIDYGDGCETPDAVRTSGRIILVFNAEQIGDNFDTTEISYTLENITYDGIIINGNARRTFIFDQQIRNIKYESTSSFNLEWEDGLTATSEFNIVKEIFSIEDQGLPGQDLYGYGFDFYALTTGNNIISFSNEDTFSTEITTPLRFESICGYTVQGTQSTIQNKEIVSLDYGDGSCDNEVIQTDSNGNETTLEIRW